MHTLPLTIRGFVFVRTFLSLILASSLLSACGGGQNSSTTSTTTESSAASTDTSGKTQVLETGSTLLYPLMNEWVSAYQASHGDVAITTQGTGSGTGIAQAISGVAQIGASDAYLSNGQMAQNAMLNIPLAISAQQVNYNVPEVGNAHINLSGPILAGIYMGSVRYWDDASIKNANAALASKLPHKEIVPIHRADGSGDTFLFTGYLSASDSAWKAGPGQSTTISWPANPRAVGATGNPGMLQTAKNTAYSVAYIGISYLDEANKYGLAYAALQNKAGKYVLPEPDTISAAANAGAKAPMTDGRVSLLDEPADNAYPIVNFEYAIVNTKQPDAARAKATSDFLAWALKSDGGQSSQYLSKVHFLPLPASVASFSQSQLSKIQSAQ